MTDYLLTHDEYERRNPDEAEMEAQYEGNRRARHILLHGGLEGYVPPREFPCPGLLRVVSEDLSAPIWEVACSACTFSTSMRSLDRQPVGVMDGRGRDEW